MFVKDFRRVQPLDTVSGEGCAMNLFPIFLRLEKRSCLVVGGGRISEGKIEGLLRAGARVRVVAPEATAKIRAWHREKKIIWQKRPYRTNNLSKSFLVIAATNSPELHRRIFRKARQLGVLCNIVDVPALCDFFYPAVVRRGPLQIAISTSGKSPALAKRLRQQLEEEFRPEYEAWLNQIAGERERVRALSLPPMERLRRLEDQVTAAAFNSFLKKHAHRDPRSQRTKRPKK